MKKHNILFLLLILGSGLSCGRTFPPLPGDGMLDAAPVVVSARPVAVNKVRVTFSEVMDPVYTLSLGNYSSGLPVLAAAADPTNGALVVLTTSNMSAASNYTLTVQGARDLAGNTNVVAEVAFNGYGADDTTPPGLSITEPLTDQLIGKSFLVYGTASDDSGIARVEIRVDSGSYQTASNTVNWTYHLDTSVYSEAYDHLVYVKATDLKGNSTVQYVSVSIDRTDPDLSVASAPSGVKVINAGQTITLSGTASDNVQFSTVAAYLTNYHGAFKYGGTWTSGTDWQIVISDTGMLDESTNRLVIVAQDLAGNTAVSNLQYVLYRNIIYIRTNGNDSGDGTYWGPRKSFYTAGYVNTAYWNQVWVADGSYNLGHVIFFADKKLMGGYSQDFSTRDILQYRTRITNQVGTTNSGTSLYLEGFEIKSITDVYDRTLSLVSNKIIGNYKYSYANWPNMVAKKVFRDNIFTNSRIQIFGTLNETTLNTGGLYFTNNRIYGKVDATTSASPASGGRFYSVYVSNTFIGVGAYTNIGLELIPVNANLGGSPSAPNYTLVRHNIFSNYYYGIQIADSSGLANELYFYENTFSTRSFGLHEFNAASDPDKFISNRFSLLSGYYYYDFDRTPKEVSTLLDLNALDEGGFNPAGSTYSNW